MENEILEKNEKENSEKTEAEIENVIDPDSNESSNSTEQIPTEESPPVIDTETIVIPNSPTHPNIMGDAEIQTVSTFDTPGGPLTVIHDITVGDLILSTVVGMFLIVYVLNNLIRR